MGTYFIIADTGVAIAAVLHAEVSSTVGIIGKKPVKEEAKSISAPVKGPAGNIMTHEMQPEIQHR